MMHYEEICSSEADENEPRLSWWFYADIAICLLIPFFGICLMTIFICSYVIKAIMCVPVPLILILGSRKRYYLDTKGNNRAHKIIAGIIRIIVYPAVILAAVLPYTMNADVRWYYPVQKAVYFSDYKSGEPQFMPAFIPDNAEDYNASFVPPVLQAVGMVMIYFRTDAETLDGFRRYAEENGTRTAGDEKRLSLPRNYGADVHDSCEVYILPEYSGYSPIYYICPESGYFVLYW